VTVRLGRPEDLVAAAEVWRASSSARRGVSDVGAKETAVVRARVAGEAWFLVAEEAGRIIGMAAASDAREDDGAGPVIAGGCHVSHVFVVPDRWGRGVGGAIVDAVLDEARRRGYRRIQLWTYEGNERAQRLYRGRGFAPTGRTMVYEHDELIGFWTREL
jgi:GNAT superfamily N-acetyltransferase